jgi:quinol monooxygenase YgiN
MFQGGMHMNHTINQKPSAAVHATIRMLIPINKQSEALDILGAVSAQVQFESSCIFSRLYRGVDDVRAIMVEERWTSDDHLRQHLQSDAYRRLLLVVEMAEEKPEFRFDTILSSTGVETIENARQMNVQ